LADEVCITVPNFVKNWSIHCGDMAVFTFLKMVDSRHLGFVWGIFRQPTESTWCSLSWYKINFGCNQCSTLDDMKVAIFGTFGLKTPIHAQRWYLGHKRD